jgi:GATA zinc finger
MALQLRTPVALAALFEDDTPCVTTPSLVAAAAASSTAASVSSSSKRRCRKPSQVFRAIDHFDVPLASVTTVPGMFYQYGPLDSDHSDGDYSDFDLDFRANFPGSPDAHRAAMHQAAGTDTSSNTASSYGPVRRSRRRRRNRHHAGDQTVRRHGTTAVGGSGTGSAARPGDGSSFDTDTDAHDSDAQSVSTINSHGHSSPSVGATAASATSKTTKKRKQKKGRKPKKPRGQAASRPKTSSSSSSSSSSFASSSIVPPADSSTEMGFSSIAIGNGKATGPNNVFRNGVRKMCHSCRTKNTPYWRDGWDGVCLCNACGIRYRKRRMYCNDCLYVPRKDERILSKCPNCFRGLFVRP